MRVFICALLFGCVATSSSAFAATLNEYDGGYDISNGSISIPPSGVTGGACGALKGDTMFTCLLKGSTSKACYDKVKELLLGKTCSWDRICLREEERDKQSALEEMLSTWCKTDFGYDASTVCGLLRQYEYLCAETIASLPDPVAVKAPPGK